MDCIVQVLTDPATRGHPLVSGGVQPWAKGEAGSADYLPSKKSSCAWMSSGRSHRSRTLPSLRRSM